MSLSFDQHEPITFFDRYKREMVTEKVDGEKPLRWLYESASGRFALGLVVRHAWFSALYGWSRRRPSSAKLIGPFCEEYGIDPSEFRDPINSFPHYAAFFERHLKPESRPICEGRGDLCFPADGRHLLITDLNLSQSFYAKGQRWNLPEFLRDQALAEEYSGGSLLISRLCPTDYHRFHFPFEGTPSAAQKIKGKLYSVNPYALRHDLSFLWRNKRQITRFKARHGTPFLMVEIGATMVGRIHQTYTPEQPVQRGDEKGFFAIGGSCIVMVFRRGEVLWEDDLLAHGPRGIEVYAHMGDRCGRLYHPLK